MFSNHHIVVSKYRIVTTYGLVWRLEVSHEKPEPENIIVKFLRDRTGRGKQGHFQVLTKCECKEEEEEKKEK